MFDEKRAREDLKDLVSKKRYKHVLGVVETALELAKDYDIDPYKVEIAALFHDFSKDLEDEEALDLLKKIGCENQVLLDKPSLAHGFTGAYILEKNYGLEDEDILSAIRKHTFGSDDMSDLDRIVFVADAIEPGRDYPKVEKYRKIAKKDLFLASMLIVRDNLKHLIKRNSKICSYSIDMYNSGLDILKEFDDDE